MPPKKANEAYFGDVFNRPTSIAFYSADGSKQQIGHIKDFDLSWAPGEVLEATVTCDIAPNCDHTAVMSKGISSTVSCTTDDIKSDINTILARLGALESQLEKKNARDGLRLALKTLNYTREL